MFIDKFNSLSKYVKNVKFKWCGVRKSSAWSYLLPFDALPAVKPQVHLGWVCDESSHEHATDILWLVEGFSFLLPRMYMIIICIWRERECPELSWEILGIIIFPFWSALFFWISCSVRICPLSLLFATFWSWKLPFQRYLQHFGVRTINFPWYLQHFGAPSVHVACIFATRVHLGLIGQSKDI